MVNFRIASTRDAAEILDIYAPYVRSTAFTFESEVPSVEEFTKRIENYLQKFPWIVCTVNNKIVAYAYASTHRERTAYQWTCESSVYVGENFRARGIGKEIYQVLFHILKHQGIRNVYAGITLPNDASVALHEKCGFEHFATYDHIGYKLGTWQKVGWWRLLINSLDKEPSPPILFSELDKYLFTDVFSTAASRIRSHLI